MAIIEAARVSDNGEILLGTGVGMSPTVAKMAKKIIIELNEAIPESVEGLHDLYLPLDPPYRREIPIYKPSDRIGETLLKVDPSKIVGIVRTNSKDGVHGFSPLDSVTEQIGANVCNFLINELRRGAIPSTFLAASERSGKCGKRSIVRAWRLPRNPRIRDVHRSYPGRSG